MKNTTAYITQRPGLEQSGKVHRYLKIGGTEQQDYGFAANEMGRLFETVSMGVIGGHTYMPALSGSTAATSGQWTATYDTDGFTAWTSAGYSLETDGDSGDHIHLQHAQKYTSADNGEKIIVFSRKMKLSAITTSIVYCGIFNTQTDPVATAPTNGVFFVITNGAIVGRVRGNSGTAASTGTLATMVADTEVEVALKFVLNGASSWCEFWVDGERTACTAAQVTQLDAITGDLYAQDFVETSTAEARVLTIRAGIAEYDA